ncbi:MAG: hypothetical protein SV760_06400 [Halobacteria archaeon]|nr:hypothetical protein [Halobacteria archaeon]
MQKVKLRPDDVLKGVGSYRDEIKVICPICDEVSVAEREDNEVECEGCGEMLGLEKPFGT